MNKKQMTKTIVSVVGLLAAAMLFLLIKDSIGNDSVRTLEMLQTYIVGGHIFDADGSLGVSDVYDVHYEWSGDEVKIIFGNNVMKFSAEELQDDYISDMLSNINLTFKGKTLYYEGMEVPK